MLRTLILLSAVVGLLLLFGLKSKDSRSSFEKQREEFLKGKTLHERLFEAGVK